MNSVYEECMANGHKLMLFDDMSGRICSVETGEEVDGIAVHAIVLQKGTIPFRVFRAFGAWSVAGIDEDEDEDTSYAVLVFYPDKTIGLYPDKEHPQRYENEIRFATPIEAVDWFLDNMWD